MPTDPVLVSIWFDTEDYSDPPSDDAAMRLAGILTELGATVTFKLVGEKLRTLERRGRGDVIAALGRQDVGFHTDWHSKHPTVPEYLRDAGWDDGVQMFLQYEGPGVEDIKRVFGQTPSCHGQAGAAWSAQAYAACLALGIPVYLDDGGGNHVRLDDVPHRYCNLLSVSHLGRAIVHVPPRTGDFMERTKADFDRAVDHARATGGGAVGVYSHEVEFSHERFADGINFMDGGNPVTPELRAPPRRSAQDVESSYKQFRDFVAYVLGRRDVAVVAPAGLVEAYADRAVTASYDLSRARTIASAFLDRPGFVPVEGGWLNAAEVLSLVLQHLTALSKGNTALRARPASPLGPKGLVDPLWGRAPVELRGGDLIAALGPVSKALETAGAVPALIGVGFASLEPEAFLRACCRLLAAVPAADLESVAVVADYVPLDAEKYVRDDHPDIWKWVVAPGFHAPHLMALAKRQAWTLKPAVRV